MEETKQTRGCAIHKLLIVTLPNEKNEHLQIQQSISAPL